MRVQPSLYGYNNSLAELNTKSEIKEIQQYLQQAGYDLGNAGVDGVLGSKTKKAVYDFFKGKIGGSGANSVVPQPVPQPQSGTLTLAVMQNTRFKNSAEINQFFQQYTGKDFVDFFRSKVGGKGYWKSRKGNAVTITAGSNARFNALFDQIPTLYNMSEINLFQFLGLVSCIINETRSFKPVRESYWVSLLGRLKYAYGTNGGRKRSYNKSSSAKTVQALIHDRDFVSAHVTPQVRLQYLRGFDWSGTTFPNVSLNNAEIDFLCQCDVYKFSGLGLIQTTWRPAYKKVIDYIINYSGSNPKILNTKMNWKTFGNSLDKIADLTKYQEWEYIFQEPHIAAKAVYLHSTRTGYLNFNVVGDSLSRMLDKAANIGYRIGGNSSYRTKVRNRVEQIIKAI